MNEQESSNGALVLVLIVVVVVVGIGGYLFWSQGGAGNPPQDGVEVEADVEIEEEALEDPGR